MSTNTRRLRVILPDGGNYDIRLGHGLLPNLGEHIREAVPTAGKAVVITDSNVGPLYLQAVKDSLAQAGIMATELCIPAGEGSKSVGVAAELWDALALLGLGRDGLVVALGGGVTGDLAGFVASTYMRGISVVQVPTSLLAMVDSSIGGKTGINLQAGKNLVGTFNQPAYVAADLRTLTTLPDAEWVNGLAEIAKSAIIDGCDFYPWITANAAALKAHDLPTVQEAIAQSLTFKARVVAADVTEKGERECLNYGHTFAHALEAAAGYGSIGHGQAVAEGMRFAARLAVEAIGAGAAFAEEQDALLHSLGLPTVSRAYDADELFNHMYSDKKVRGGELRFVLCTAPGQWQTVAVDPDLVKIYLLLWEQARAGR